MAATSLTPPSEVLVELAGHIASFLYKAWAVPFGFLRLPKYAGRHDSQITGTLELDGVMERSWMRLLFCIGVTDKAI